MSQVRVNNITNRTGITGPTVAGIANVNSSSHFVVPTGRTGQRYADEGENIVRDGLVLYLDAKYSYPSKTGIGTTTSGAAAPAGSSTDPDVYNWYDMSGYENNGELINQVGYNAANGGSLVFDGVNDYVKVNHFDVGNSITVEGWFNSKSTSWGPIIGNWNSVGPGDSWLLTRDTSNQMRFYVMFDSSTTGVVVDPQTLTNNVWNQYTATFNNFTLSLYKNGVLISSKKTTANTIYQNSLEIWLGRFSTFYFGGNIGNCKVYNRALTDAEVLQNYNALKGRFGLS